jgi:hypothetical protein
MENNKRAAMRTKTHEAPNPILNHGLEVPIHELWTFYDFREWTGSSIGEIVQAVIFGLCREPNYEVIERIFRNGGLKVKPGVKEPLP